MPFIVRCAALRCQIECRNRRGSDKKGRKVTALQWLGRGEQLLVTTNDSRVRLVHMDDYSLSCKYKGNMNGNMQIRASCSPDFAYVICGSEDNSVYIWRTLHDQFTPSNPRYGSRHHL